MLITWSHGNRDVPCAGRTEGRCCRVMLTCRAELENAMERNLALRDVVHGQLTRCSCYLCRPMWCTSSVEHVCWSTYKSLRAHRNLVHSVRVPQNLAHLRNRVDVISVVDHLSRGWVVLPAGVPCLLRSGFCYCVEWSPRVGRRAWRSHWPRRPRRPCLVSSMCRRSRITSTCRC